MKKVDEDRTGISSLLSLLSENQKEKEIFVGRKKEIEALTFLPLQVTKDNGVIPYQVNEIEVNVILDTPS